MRGAWHRADRPSGGKQRFWRAAQISVAGAGYGLALGHARIGERVGGPHSCAPKSASSAAALQGSPRNGSEALGAYGWQLTLDEAKWLLDWHLVRGNNLFFLHAVFYSVRGRRAYESEPDLGLHNVWWPHFGLLADYLRRLCWLLSDGVEVCDRRHPHRRQQRSVDGRQSALPAADRFYLHRHNCPGCRTG